MSYYPIISVKVRLGRTPGKFHVPDLGRETVSAVSRWCGRAGGAAKWLQQNLIFSAAPARAGWLAPAGRRIRYRRSEQLCMNKLDSLGHGDDE